MLESANVALTFFAVSFFLPTPGLLFFFFFFFLIATCSCSRTWNPLVDGIHAFSQAVLVILEQLRPHFLGANEFRHV